MRPELQAIALRQGGVFTRAQALTVYSRPQVERLVRERTWHVLRHGIYAAAPADVVTTAAARWLALGGRDVISHETAAQWHGLNLLRAYGGVPMMTRLRPAGAAPVRVQGLYAARVPPGQRLIVRGVPVTTLARTVADLARQPDRDAGLVVVESALGGGMRRQELLDVLMTCAGWPGAQRARDLAVFGTRWSETALESLARCWFEEQGIPQPEQQRVIRRADGGFVGRVDFLWRRYRTVCEVDGRTKYESDAAALWKEKRREDTMRDLGLEVVRGYWSDGGDRGAELAERLRRAFGRGLGATESAAYLIESPRFTPRHAQPRAS